MRLTLTLDDELLAKAEEYTGISNKSALVRESLKKLVERRPPAGWRVSAVASPSSSRSRGGGRNVGDRSIDQPRGARAALVRPHEPRIPRHIGGEDRGETAGLAHAVSPAARRRPER